MAERPLIAHHRAGAASGVEMMSTQVHNRLSSSRFINMCVANWFLHIFIFATVPLLAVLVENLGGTPAWTGYAVLAFAAKSLCCAYRELKRIGQKQIPFRRRKEKAIWLPSVPAE